MSYPTDSVVDVRRDLVILHDRRFGLLFVARTVSVLGSAFGPVALAFGVLALPGATATTLSVVTAAEAAAMVAFMLIGGVIADRLPRFRVMVVADTVAALAWGGLAAMLITGWAPMWLLVLSSAVAGMATALFFPAFTGVVPEIVPAPKLQAANGILRLGMNFARIGGFAVAGGAVALFGAGWAMALNAGLLAVSAALIAGLRPSASTATVRQDHAAIRPGVPDRGDAVRPAVVDRGAEEATYQGDRVWRGVLDDVAVRPAVADGGAERVAYRGDAVRPAKVAAYEDVAVRPAGNMLRDLKEGWNEFRSREWLWVVVLQYSFVMMVFQAVWSVLGPVVANDRLGGAKGWSWVLAAESIGMLVGVVFAIRWRPKRPIRLVVLLTFPLASLPLALGLGAPLFVAVAAAFVSGVAIDILVVIWDTTMQREIPPEALSRVSSYDALGTLMLGPIGLVLAGPSVGLIGAKNALLISAAVTGLATAVALCSPGVRNLRWTNADPAPEPTALRSVIALDQKPSHTREPVLGSESARR
jgi:MFS family permease